MIAPIISFIVSPVGRYLAGALAILAVVGGIYMKGRSDGKAVVRAQWEAAERAAIEKGNAARRDAERAVRDGVRDPRDRDDN